MVLTFCSGKTTIVCSRQHLFRLPVHIAGTPGTKKCVREDSMRPGLQKHAAGKTKTAALMQNPDERFSPPSHRHLAKIAKLAVSHTLDQETDDIDKCEWNVKCTVDQ